MFHFLGQLPWGLAASAVALVFVACAAIAIILMRRMTNHSSLHSHHDVASVVFANLGVLYSVLLGFTVVNVQQRFDQIATITQLEATILEQLYLDAKVFSGQKTKAIQTAIANYTKSVIDEEWRLMQQGGSMHTSEKLKALWNVYYTLEPQSPKEEIWYQVSVGQLNKLMKARLSRLIGSQESLSAEMWSLLIFGALMMVGFMCFFGLKNLWVHLALGASLAATTGVLLLLIYSLDTAFMGAKSIEPMAMERIFKDFN